MGRSQTYSTDDLNVTFNRCNRYMVCFVYRFRRNEMHFNTVKMSCRFDLSLMCCKYWSWCQFNVIFMGELVYGMNENSDVYHWYIKIENTWFFLVKCTLYQNRNRQIVDWSGKLRWICINWSIQGMYVTNHLTCIKYFLKSVENNLAFPWDTFL